jgi:hypothetical protein
MIGSYSVQRHMSRGVLPSGVPVTEPLVLVSGTVVLLPEGGGSGGGGGT